MDRKYFTQINAARSFGRTSSVAWRARRAAHPEPQDEHEHAAEPTSRLSPRSVGSRGPVALSWWPSISMRSSACLDPAINLALRLEPVLELPAPFESASFGAEICRRADQVLAQHSRATGCVVRSIRCRLRRAGISSGCDHRSSPCGIAAAIRPRWAARVAVPVFISKPSALPLDAG